MGILDDLAMKSGKKRKNSGNNFRSFRASQVSEKSDVAKLDPLIEQGLEEYFDMYNFTTPNKKLKL